MEPPETLAVSFNEAVDSFDNVLVCDGEVVDEVHEYVIDLCITLLRTDRFQDIKDVRGGVISLGDEVLSRADTPQIRPGQTRVLMKKQLLSWFLRATP